MPHVDRPPRAQLLAAALATVLLALIAGFFYAYACSVMVGLAHTDDVVFLSAMQAINAHVRNLGFAPTFFGALIVTALAVALGARRWRSRATVLLAAALLTYGLGGFLLTLGFSVPLNEQLAAAGDPGALADPATVRAAYEQPWTAWNLVRTLASTMAFGLACAAVYELGRELTMSRIRGGAHAKADRGVQTGDDGPTPGH
ncbi:anthrone oxygenase family protein [Longispora sp. NPDC051575]|uniref:anthrone oxygenase family protein n=1 Tax=Longispora sp. NPDC051575 TaxID=3154943 RepID=UPI0034377272